MKPEDVLIALHGSLPDAIQDAGAGFHFEEGGCWAFAVAMKKILDDLGIRSSIRVLDGKFRHAMVKVGDTLIDHQGVVLESSYQTKDSSVEAISRLGIQAQGEGQFESDVIWADEIIRDALS